MKTQTIKQKTISIEFETGNENQKRTIVVHRMEWKPAKEFMRMIAKILGGLGANLGDVLTKLPEIITSTEELSTYLVTNSTDLNADAIDKLDLVQALALIEAAIELNAGPELKNSFAGIAAILVDLMPAGATKMISGAMSTPAS